MNSLRLQLAKLIARVTNWKESDQSCVPWAKTIRRFLSSPVRRLSPALGLSPVSNQRRYLADRLTPEPSLLLRNSLMARDLTRSLLPGPQQLARAEPLHPSPPSSVNTTVIASQIFLEGGRPFCRNQTTATCDNTSAHAWTVSRFTLEWRFFKVKVCTRPIRRWLYAEKVLLT